MYGCEGDWAKLFRRSTEYQGTQLLQDTTPGGSGTNYVELVSLGTRALASAGNPQEGQELLVTDGTPAGTTLVSILPGAEASAPAEFLIEAPADGVRVVAVTTGIGMTTGLGLGESVITDLFSSTSGAP